MACRRQVKAAWIQASAFTESLYPQSQWKGAPFGHPNHAGQGDASPVFAGFGAGVGVDERSELVWVQVKPLDGRRHVPDFRCHGPAQFIAMGARSGYQGVL